MGNAIPAAAPALCTAIGAVELFCLLFPQPGAYTTAQAQALRNAVRAFLPLAAAGGLFTSVLLIYRHLRGAAADAAARNRRLSEILALLFASAGLLYFFLFVAQAPAGAGGVDPAGAAARELGLAALRALPAAAAVTFYLGMLLIIIRHIHAGGEGGGGAVAGNGPVEAPAVGLLDKMAIGANADVVNRGARAPRISPPPLAGGVEAPAAGAASGSGGLGRLGRRRPL
ncbi:unnamed protein product [Urochloa humidicola]